uniref:Dolichyl-diphosphooligosaccharide-protein glycosyltransferase subunit OST5 n=1 Tax=Alexandrium monilatum TaxID=311494 RepID=A0A7S4VMI1_9DINO
MAQAIWAQAGTGPADLWVRLSTFTFAMAPAVETVQMPPTTREFLARLNPEMYSGVALFLIFIGSLVGIHFLYYEVSMLKRPHERGLVGQLLAALLTSVCLGFGAFLLLAWAGVYV